MWLDPCYYIVLSPFTGAGVSFSVLPEMLGDLSFQEAELIVLLYSSLELLANFHSSVATSGK